VVQARATLGLWKKRRAENLDQNVTLHLLLYLFDNPINAFDDGCLQRIINCFEQSVIQDAVIKYYIHRKNIDFDPVEVLRRFGNGIGELSKFNALDFLRGLDMILKDLPVKNNDCIERYTKQNSSVWSCIMNTFSKRDLLLFYSLDKSARPAGIEVEFEKRAMFEKATKLYLDNNSILEAASCSNKALATIKLADANAESLVDMWNEGLNSQQSVHQIPGNCKLWLLLNLFRDPSESTKVGRQCMDCFGKRVVEVAVKRKIKDAKRAANILLKFEPEKRWDRKIGGTLRTRK